MVVYSPGYIKQANLEYLPITRSFFPSTYRSWLVPFWQLDVKWIFVAMPFGFVSLQHGIKNLRC